MQGGSGGVGSGGRGGGGGHPVEQELALPFLLSSHFNKVLILLLGAEHKIDNNFLSFIK